MKLNRNVHTFLGFEDEYTDAELVVFGAPFDGTTSFRPGTRFASDIMRSDSYGLETYSPYLDKDLDDYKLFDGGDLELPFGNPQRALDDIEAFAKGIIEDNKKPFMIGGEHLVTLPVVKALYEKHEDLYLIHLDAHTDLREDYMGEKLSHASVIKRCWDFLGDDRIFQFGIRSGLREEFEWAKSHTTLRKFDLKGLEEVVEKLKDKKVYITIDLDVLDPSIFAGTGTPEAGGISFKEMLGAIEAFNKLENVVGCDIVELAPHYDQSGVSNAVACKVLRELTLAVLK